MWLPVGSPNSKGRDIFFHRSANGKEHDPNNLLIHGIFQKKARTLNKLKRRGDVKNLGQPTTSKINVTVDDEKVLVVPSKSRCFKLVTNYTAIEDILVTLVKMRFSLNQRKRLAEKVYKKACFSELY